MIDKIVESMHGKVEDLRLFEKVYPLAEQKEVEGRTVLASYIGKGEYEYITNFDNYNGVAYFRKTEDTEISRSEIGDIACGTLLNIRYPLRFVCCIRRDQLPEDCAFSDDSFAYQIIQELTDVTPTFKSALKAVQASSRAVSFSTDRKKILNQELPGNDIIDINYQYSLIAIEFNVTIDIDQNCILTPCETYG